MAALGIEAVVLQLGKLLLATLAAAPEKARHLIVERTQAGLARAKAEGKILGRRPKTTPEQRKAIMEG